MSSPPLYWKTVPMQMIGVSFADLLSMAKPVFVKAGLTDIKKTTVDVSGRTPNTHAAVTFLGTGGGSFSTIVMVAGSDGNETKTVRKKLSDGLAKLTTL